MLRILQVVSSLDGGGVEAMLYNYYTNMDKTMVRFDFIVHDPNIGILESKFKELGSNIYHVTPKKVSFIRNAKEINAVIRTGTYDVVHSHQNESSFLALYLAKINRIKVRIAHSHAGFANQKIHSKIFIIPSKVMTKRFATDWLACSDIAGKWLFGQKISNKKFSVFNNAINVDKFTFNEETRKYIRNKFNWDNKFIIGNVARFFPEKNHPFLIRIFNEVHKKNPEAMLVLVGGGKEEAKIRTYVDELGLTKNVLFLGVRNDVETLMQAIDVFLLPSKSEGLGIVLVEAQAAGLKCFASNVIPKETHITDLIEYISLDQPPEYWAERILTSSNDYVRKDNSSLIRLSHFDIKKEGETLLEYYKEMYKNNI